MLLPRCTFAGPQRNAIVSWNPGAVYAVTVGLAHGASPFAPEDWRLVATACVAAFAGVVLAKKYVRKVEMTSVRWLTGVLLLSIGALLGAGWI